jgi:hypothetical protein
MRDVADDRARAILGSAVEITEAQERAAGICLAGLALQVAGGDWEEAKALLAVPLEAIGAIPYEAVQPRSIWGRPYQERGTAS